MTEPQALATEDDHLIEATDNSSDPGAAEVDQDPEHIIESDTDDPGEVTS